MDLQENISKFGEYDTNNSRVYGLVCDQIRDFCADAIISGRLPNDKEIEQVVGNDFLGECGKTVTVVL